MVELVIGGSVNLLSTGPTPSSSPTIFHHIIPSIFQNFLPFISYYILFSISHKIYHHPYPTKFTTISHQCLPSNHILSSIFQNFLQSISHQFLPSISHHVVPAISHQILLYISHHIIIGIFPTNFNINFSPYSTSHLTSFLLSISHYIVPSISIHPYSTNYCHLNSAKYLQYYSTNHLPPYSINHPSLSPIIFYHLSIFPTNSNHLPSRCIGFLPVTQRVVETLLHSSLSLILLYSAIK